MSEYMDESTVVALIAIGLLLWTVVVAGFSGLVGYMLGRQELRAELVYPADRSKG